MIKKVNAIGDACPIPVVKTKQAIKEIEKIGGTVETLVDNEIAVQNLTKMAKQKGYSVRSEKLEERKYLVEMVIGSGKEQMDPETGLQEETCYPDSRKKHTVVGISSSFMGEGDPKLGAILMKGYIYALSQQDELPATILFYNGGVKLVCEEGPILEDLKSLEAQGVELLACGTCLDFYGLKDNLKVGTVTNMYTIAETMSQASLLIKP